MSGGRDLQSASIPEPTLATLTPLAPPPTGAIEVGVVDTGLEMRYGKPHGYVALHLPSDEIEPDLMTAPGLVGHGTAVAGLIIGEAPQARIVMKGVLERFIDKAEDEAVAQAIRDLHLREVTLINLSFCGAIGETETPECIVRAIDELPDHAIVVAAAGDHGSRRRVFPAGLDSPKVRAVGAVDELALETKPPVAEFSNFGRWVHGFGPGGHRLVPLHLGYAFWSGTSFAAAVVTGRIAALMTEQGVTAQEAARQVFAGGGLITVHDACGEFERPYIKSALGDYP